MVNCKSTTRSRNSDARTSATSDAHSHAPENRRDNPLIRDLKKRRVLHYQPTMDLSPTSRDKHYSEISANTAFYRAGRTIKKCNDTIAKLEKMQAKN